MAYSKLFSSIINSSLWTEPDHVRLLFITMLAIADREGYVYGSRSGLIRQAMLDPDECEEIDPIQALMMPDKDSSDRLRNPENEGRRIEEVPQGFRIINYSYYRALRNDDDRREQNREAQRRFKEKHKPKSAKISQGKPRKAHAEADADAKKDSGANGSHPTSDWLKDLAKNPAYQGIDVQREFGKMNAWCDTNRKQATRRRFVNWLNRCDKPLHPEKTESPYGKRYMTPAREPTEAELAAQRKIVRESSEAFKKQMRHETD